MKPKIQARKPAQRINLVDIGSGDARTLARLASRKRRTKSGKTELAHEKIIGIDLKRSIFTNRKNLKMLVGDALKKLKNIPSNSVNVINADLLFNSIWKITGEKDPALALKKAEPYILQLLKEANRVLVPNGRFRIVELSRWAEEVEKLLQESGFETRTGSFSFEETENPQSNLSTRTKGIFRELKDYDDGFEGFIPLKIFAIKRIQK